MLDTITTDMVVTADYIEDGDIIQEDGSLWLVLDLEDLTGRGPHIDRTLELRELDSESGKLRRYLTINFALHEKIHVKRVRLMRR